MIASVVLDHGGSSAPRLASADTQGSFAVVRFAPQATFTEINNFLGAYRATVVEGPMKSAGMYRIRLSETPLKADEVGKIIRQMQSESRIIGFVAVAPRPQ